ncbi:L,D-transpeptidase family protein [Brucella endophytica]|uniref:L,D-transpeptidase family protein n=1 Tax=Brucella endophytica TaxID=1963359 RepID=UPI00166A1D3D|nr:L,D-transpeptidase family protein [Brucella endophytica]
MKRADSKSLRRIDVRSRPGNPSQGLLVTRNLVLPCALGKRGITAFKREGDGATPLGAMRLLYGWRRRRRNFAPVSLLPFRTIHPDDGWCDASADRNYNRRVAVPYGPSHEKLWRDDGLYDICIVLDWNIRPRRRGRGSAIFFHLARTGYLPTEGCIALKRADMARLLPYLNSGTTIRVLR